MLTDQIAADKSLTPAEREQLFVELGAFVRENCG